MQHSHIKWQSQLLDVEWTMTALSSVQNLSCVWLFATPWIVACQASLSISNSQSSLKLTSIELVMHRAISSSVVLFSSCPQSLPASESFPMSQLSTWGGQSTGVSASASVLPMNTQDWSLLEDWLDLLVVQGTLQSLLQHHSSKASILRPIALTRWTFVGKVTSLLFNMLSRSVITFKA